VTASTSAPSAHAKREALDLIAAQPGITVTELRDALGVGQKRVWQIIERLEAGHVRRAGDAPMRRGPR
jgi:DNA-binding MarR family transcriptional regulator